MDSKARKKEILAKIAQTHIEMGEAMCDMASHSMDLSDAADQMRNRYVSRIKQLEKDLKGE